VSTLSRWLASERRFPDNLFFAFYDAFPALESPLLKQLDTKGLLCPEPVMMLHNAVRDLASGELLEVLATDPSTRRDIPKFCAFLDHELVEQSEQDGTFRYLIRKG
jgi:tRNA 2-thiouridine synthesizing protein A